MKVYFISGLGSDERVFKYIQLPAHCEVVHLHWIEPIKNESLNDYALRLAEKINKDEPFSIIGLSMGGMLASEISKKLNPVNTILLSSIPSSNELPFYFKIAGKLKIHKAVPISLVKSGAVVKYFFTVRSQDNNIIIQQMIKSSNTYFMRWAMDAILKWKNESGPSKYIHIHGSHDKTLPIRFTKPTHIIPKAGHLMVMTNASQVNKILGEALTAN